MNDGLKPVHAAFLAVAHVQLKQKLSEIYKKFLFDADIWLANYGSPSPNNLIGKIESYRCYELIKVSVATRWPA